MTFDDIDFNAIVYALFVGLNRQNLWYPPRSLGSGNAGNYYPNLTLTSGKLT